MNLHHFLNVAEDLEIAGLIWKPEIGDEVTDRFCVLGEVAEVVDKLHVLADAGVDQFNVYLMNGDEREQLERIGREIIPAMSGVAAG